MGCRNVPNATEIKTDWRAAKAAKRMNINEVYNSNQTNNTRQEELVEENRSYSSNTQQQTHKTASKVEKFSYHLPNAESKDAASRKVSSASTTAAGGQGYETQHQQAKKVWEERQALSPVHHHHQDQNERTTNFSAESYQQHHHQQHHQQYHQQEEIYQRRENLSFPELLELSAATIINRPALPPKTKIMNSPSRNIFSPTGSDHGGGDDSLASTTTTTASVKTVEFLPVREKVKLIAAQQEELCRREQEADPDAKRPKGVRILPPSPVTVRKMSVEEELYYYDKVVTRTTPVTQVMEQEDNRITGDIWGGKKAEVQVSKKEETGYQESSSSVKTMNFSSETKTTSSSFFASQQTAAAAQSAQWLLHSGLGYKLLLLILHRGLELKVHSGLASRQLLLHSGLGYKQLLLLLHCSLAYRLPPSQFRAGLFSPKLWWMKATAQKLCDRSNCSCNDNNSDWTRLPTTRRSTPLWIV